jgi:hypothetical protein
MTEILSQEEIDQIMKNIMGAGENTERKKKDMTEYKLRYEEKKTGCQYCWDRENQQWLKVCPVAELPAEIRQMVLADKERAELYLEAKI